MNYVLYLQAPPVRDSRGEWQANFVPIANLGDISSVSAWDIAKRNYAHAQFPVLGKKE